MSRSHLRQYGGRPFRMQRRIPVTTPNVQVNHPIFRRIHRECPRNSAIGNQTHPRMETENQPENEPRQILIGRVCKVECYTFCQIIFFTSEHEKKRKPMNPYGYCVLCRSPLYTKCYTSVTFLKGWPLLEEKISHILLYIFQHIDVFTVNPKRLTPPIPDKPTLWLGF